MVPYHPDAEYLALMNYPRARLAGSEQGVGPRPRRIDEDFHG